MTRASISLLWINKTLARYFNVPRYQIRRHIRDFVEIIGPCDLIIDVGSGLDMPYRNLFNFNRYFGLDLYESASVKADISLLPIVAHDADVVICTEVLEHVPDPERVLSEIHRILKCDRYLVLAVPLIWGEHDYVDYQRWTQAGLRKLLSSSGFDVLLLKKRGGIFSSLGCVLSHIPNQIFGNFSQQRNWFLRILYLFCIPFAIIVPWLFLPFDFLDRSKHYVVGYSVLCKRV